jgi:hypothetical protein
MPSHGQGSAIPNLGTDDERRSVKKEMDEWAQSNAQRWEHFFHSGSLFSTTGMYRIGGRSGWQRRTSGQGTL